MDMRWDATLVTRFEGLSQYPKFHNSATNGPSAIRLRWYISINNYVVVDMAYIRNMRARHCTVRLIITGYTSRLWVWMVFTDRQTNMETPRHCLFLFRYKTTFSCLPYPFHTFPSSLCTNRRQWDRACRKLRKRYSKKQTRLKRYRRPFVTFF